MPASNTELARAFNRIADALELKGETGFRVLAYRRAARALLELAEDVAELDRAGELESVPGIGSGIAGKIHEYLTTGKMKKYEEAQSGLPQGLFPLLDIQGLGPKTVKLLHEELGVSNLEDLKQVIRDGSAAELPGLGQQRMANIARAIMLTELTGDRMYLNQASTLAQSVIDYLSAIPQARSVTAAGSLRRGKETIGDIDILVAGTRPAAVTRKFLSHPGVCQKLASGSTKASALFETETGVRQVDVRVVTPAAFGAALQYFTGSKEHNVAVRALAQKKGLKVSEYGVFRGEKVVARRTEKAVYAALGLPCIPPELRENRGEIEAAIEGRLPRLVTLADIRCDLHIHTNQSDGSASIEDIVRACKRRGYTHIAITEHSVSAGYAGGLSPAELARHCDRVDRFNSRSRRFRILKASEVDITTSGALDYQDKLLARLHLVIASIHQGFRKNATERMCAALEHPLVHMVAHPTGRIIGRREGYDIDLERVIETAARRGKVLEINAFYGRLDLNDIWARRAAQAGVRLAVNTDAHAVEDLDWMQYGILTARRAWLTKTDIINCLPLARLLKLLADIRSP